MTRARGTCMLRHMRRMLCRAVPVICILLLCASPAMAASDAPPVSADLHEIDAWGEHARLAKTMLILLQIAAILSATKITGWLAERIKVPGVIGELLAGIIIGPYVLGQHVWVPLSGHWSPLFPPPTPGQ